MRSTSSFVRPERTIGVAELVEQPDTPYRAKKLFGLVINQGTVSHFSFVYPPAHQAGTLPFYDLQLVGLNPGIQRGVVDAIFGCGFVKRDEVSFQVGKVGSYQLFFNQLI